MQIYIVIICYSHNNQAQYWSAGVLGPSADHNGRLTRPYRGSTHECWYGSQFLKTCWENETAAASCWHSRFPAWPKVSQQILPWHGCTSQQGTLRHVLHNSDRHTLVKEAKTKHNMAQNSDSVIHQRHTEVYVYGVLRSCRSNGRCCGFIYGTHGAHGYCVTGDVNHPVTSDIFVHCFKVEGRGRDVEE